MALTDKQRAARDGAIGSSDAPIVAGVSSYSSPTELFYKLIGKLPRYTEEETRAQRIGSLIQDPIGYLTAEDLGLKIRRCAPRIHPKHPFMAANLDFEIVNNPKGPGCLEIKNRSADRPYEELPQDIECQVAHQLAVTQREWAIVAVLFGFGQLKTYEVKRNKELEEALIEIEARFMLHVQKAEPPKDDWTSRNVAILRKAWPQDNGKQIALAPEMGMNAIGFLAAKAEIEAAEARKAVFEGLLQSAMEDAAVAQIPGFGEVTWRTSKESQKFDVAQFEKDQPELFKQYLKPVAGSRRFYVKPYKRKKENSCRMNSLPPDQGQNSSSPVSSGPLSSPSSLLPLQTPN